MNDKLTNYVNGIFAPYNGIKSVEELKNELSLDLEERFLELKEDGKDDDAALSITIDGIGDIEQTLQEVANASRSLERKILTNFNASNLTKSDFAGVTAHSGKFNGSALGGSDFSNADLTGSSFAGSDVSDTNFDGTDLTDCCLSAIDLNGSTFEKSILVRTNISKSGLVDAVFKDAKLVDANLSMNDLRKTTFKNCVFDGVDFQYCDLRGLCFDKQTFISVKFDKSALENTTFKNATLRNVSFLSGFTFSKKFYRAIKTICFDGAMMDKLTYASLKGMDADLANVTII